MKLLVVICLLALAPVANAKLVEDHSSFDGTYELTDGNVKDCEVELVLKGQPEALIINTFVNQVSDFDPSAVPVGRRMSISKFLSATEFNGDFVDNIDVPGVLVQINTNYKVDEQGGLVVVKTNSYPDPHFSAPAYVKCTYRVKSIY